MQLYWVWKLVLLQLYFTTTTSATYVQHQQCDNEHNYVPLSLWAALTPTRGAYQLAFQATNYVDKSQCEALSNISVNLRLEGLGWSSSHLLTTNTTCHKSSRPAPRPYMLRTSFGSDIELGPLSTFRTRVQLLEDGESEFNCASANITPALDPVTANVLRWFPCALLIFIFIYGAFDSLYVSDPSDDDAGGLDMPQRVVRPILPYFGDCLQYLQFVFLSGGLTLYYPGFYRPAVSQLSWFSLFHSGPVTRALAYNGTSDGIYEINGTYGGTSGLELMHQIAATPGTVATWLNMVVSILIIAVAAGILLECLSLFRTPGPESPDGTISKAGGFRYRCASLLRVLFSYFTMPVMAMTFYQFTKAALLPQSHTIYAAALTIFLIALFGWLLYQVPVRNLGLLVFNKSAKYQQLATDDSPEGFVHDKAFVLVLFTLLFIRGAAIGGLQDWGLAQLLVLIACELVLLICIFALKTYPVSSVVTVASIARLVSVALMSCFLRGLVGTNAKALVGYLILALHALMLLFGFFVPTTIRVGQLCARRWNRPKPDVYSLRQLRRRHNSRTDLCTAFEGSHTGEEATSPSIRSLQNEAAIPTTYHFRTPRTSSLRTTSQGSQRSMDLERLHHTGRGHERALSPLSQCEQTIPEFSKLSGEHHTVPLKLGDKHMAVPTANAGTRECTSSSGSDGSSEGSRSLGPRWDDYSFRESDLYYGRPAGPGRTHVWGEQEAPADNVQPKNSSPFTYIKVYFQGPR